jgi:hypothetical protein
MIPTSDKNGFLAQLNNPNKHLPINFEQAQQINKTNKNIVLSYVSDSAGCGHIRNIFPFIYMNAVFAREGKLVPMIAPFFLYQQDILLRTRSIFFQRQMSPDMIPQIRQYKDLQKSYRYKMIFDIDDFIWDGPEVGEHIPEYNFASTQLKDDVKHASKEIMNMMDLVTVSTPFLKDYLSTHGIKVPIEVLPNTVPKYFWGSVGKRAPIKERKGKLKIILTQSPTHYCQQRKLIGDWGANDNMWLDWIIKNVKENKIDVLCMGGLPFFFDSIRNKIHVIEWVNSFQYHIPILKFKADFCFMPLVPNYFNYGKSQIKYLESCVAGSIGVGSTFTNGKPSPYEDSIVKIPDNWSINQFDEKIKEYSEIELFNKTIQEQYKYIDENNYWTESESFINKFASFL